MMQFRIFLHFLLWSLVFLQGLIQTLSLPSFSYKVGIPLSVILLFFTTKPNKRKRMPFFGYILIILIILIFSSLVNSISLFNFIYFVIYITLPYFYFVIVLNEPNEIVINRIKKIIFFYVLIQIPISIGGFIMLGQYEGNAGSLTNSAGSVSSIFPAVVTAYLFSLYLFNKKIKYLLLILGFFIFGLIGEKRAVTLFIPIVIFLVYSIPLIKQKKFFSTKSIKSLMTVLIFSGFAFYGAIRLNPTLNKEGKIGGSFDYEYFVNYSKQYNKVGRDDDDSEMQRLEGFMYFNSYMLNNSIINTVIGDGAGKLISSRYSKNTNANLMLEYYNVRYGGRMGYIWLLLQIGYLGVIVYLSMFISFFNKVWKKRKFSSNEVAFLVMTVIFFLDTLFYSKVFIRYFYIMGVYMFLFAIIMRENIFIKQKVANN
jgi:hypothetical protein